ncbi:diguanylate cyclase [Agromyces mediolanus]|uniref:diguanylate cyclase domain-containing protein n=1 Tax=Agromyces mediolanus TaxID=41986 RepID=UPI003838FE45
MTIDLYTVQLATSTVTIIAGLMFILDTVLRRPDAAGRLWAVSFMGGMLTSISYAVWILVPGAWWAVGVGNGAMVLTAGLLWSGARAFNARNDLLWVPLVAATAAGVAVVAEGPDGGDWAGALPLFFALAAFSALGAAESLRRPMRSHWAARGLTVSFIVVALYYAFRTAAFLLVGPGDTLFRTFFGSEASAFVMMTLIIVMTVSLVILRSDRPAEGGGDGAHWAEGEVLAPPAMRRLVEDQLERANFHDDQLVFLRVGLDEVEAINTAFGRSASAALADRFTAAVRRYAPPTAAVGAIDGGGELLVVAPFPRMADARRAAIALQAGIGEQTMVEADGLRLSASIGMAGSDAEGYDFDRLVAASGEAVERARESGGDAIAD